jgi:hypothetical protein
MTFLRLATKEGKITEISTEREEDRKQLKNRQKQSMEETNQGIKTK